MASFAATISPVWAGDQRGVRHVPGEDVVDGLADRLQQGGVERRFFVEGCEPRREQQGVSFAQGKAEALSETYDEGPAGPGAAAFDEAHVPLCRVGSHGELELAPSAAVAPPPERFGEVIRRGHGRHGGMSNEMTVGRRFPRGNCCRRGRAHRGRHDGTPNTSDLADRYVAMWNEPDDAARRVLICSTWTPDGCQILLDPPEAARAEAADLRFGHPSLEVHGHAGLEGRITRAFEMFVEPGGHCFQACGPVEQLLPGVLVVRWEMVSVADGTHVGGGADILDLDDEGRIQRDFQFIER